MFKLQDIKPILVPQYEELSADKMYSKVKGYIDNFADYFSDYNESYIPLRKHFWDIFSTLNQELAEKFIDHSIKERNKQKVTQESKIEISEEIMNQINWKQFNSRQKGRALSMLVSSREIYKVNRKRKREYIPYEVSKEEVKEYQKKRSKPMNDERRYDNDGRWKDNDQEEFEEELRRIKRTMNDNDEDEMKIDGENEEENRWMYDIILK